jgi:hypothetical protein
MKLRLNEGDWMRAFAFEPIPKLYAIGRKHVGRVLLPLAAVALVYTSITNSQEAELVFLFCGAAAISIMVITKWSVSEVNREFQGGKIIAYEFAPRPINSLMKALRDHVSISSIETIRLMSADIEQSDNYYNNGNGNEKPLVRILEDECPEAKVIVYGPCKNSNLKSKNAQIEFVPTVGPLTKHTNLIVTKDGRSFVWHEPYHQIKGKEHILTGGAYLISVDEKLRHKIESAFDLLASDARLASMSIHEKMPPLREAI